MSNSTQFLCKCKQMAGWITENEDTKPCPNCGRIYFGKYNDKTLNIDAICIKE